MFESLAIDRVKEHESSVRLLNERTTLGEHILHSHPPSPSKLDKIKEQKGKRDFDNFFEHYQFTIKRKCRDTLETFIYEGLDIARTQPELNVMKSNGFIF